MNERLENEELLKLLSLQEISPEESAEIQAIIEGTDTLELAPELAKEKAEMEASSPPPAPARPDADLVTESPEGEDIRTQISKMKLPQKIKYAMFGNSTCRALLIRDANKMIQMFVLKNPRMQAREVEEFAKNPNLSDQVLRTIGNNSTWMKSYLAKWNLVSNPKTPVDISLKWLKYLNTSEIRRLARSKNIPQVLVTAARKKLEQQGPE